MISSSPSAAALLCASPNHPPAAAPDIPSQSPFFDAHRAAAPPPPPPPPPAAAAAAAPARSPASSRLPRPDAPCVRSIPVRQEIQVALRRQTVDAGTQYSRPASPAERVVPLTHQQPSSRETAAVTDNSTSLPSPTTTSSRTTALSGELPSSDVQSTQASASPEPGSRMPSATAGTKRSTPDTRAAASCKATRSNTGEDGLPDGSIPKRPRPEQLAPKVLPRQYENADSRDLVVLISSMLMELIRFNDQIPLRDGRLTRFHSRSPPRISVQDYLQRLTTHATLSPPVLLSMVYYIDRLCALYPAFTVSSLTVHRFLITAATVASKGLSDSFWTNKTYSRVGGITIAELALLELEFLWRVEWRIVPQPEVLVDYYRSLVERCDEYVLEPENNTGQ
ncbi:cyclin-dependent protein kinase regulator Pho80 [Coccidioides immitis RS]|uniref:Cyclin-dependent protein kinase regulator Pho80 n=2 Tax=Coccidioides immitis TaxID=5501 RepID=J3KLF2_COCIM|nr:cyclin-dependent protein kinase regulator Pho80 [Coccidioides immitis RS]EAS37104.3 cyclin-dependent protein kinase regulator Pho80 [Coccidioides immitis RS]KMP10045.1 cyclin-dependent protein kinase regulator Pho80 [Coccidioides immitis RMSCC 2394]